MSGGLTLGAIYLGDRKCRFTVWAPSAGKVEVHIVEPEEQIASLLREGDRGYHSAVVEGVDPGSRYRYRLDGERIKRFKVLAGPIDQIRNIPQNIFW